MLSPQTFVKTLTDNNLSFFAGVPDSLLKELCACVTDILPSEQQVIAANEGNAVGLAIGHYLATSQPGVVYMQNSGQGNAVNPLMSLADDQVYGIPVLLLIGWRGEPDVHDEPQHKKQGVITLSLLDTMGIPYKVLPDDEESAKQAVAEAVAYLAKENAPYALVVKKGTFDSYQPSKKSGSLYELAREKALKIVLTSVPESAIIVSTTGMLSRELFEQREQAGQGHDRDFLTVGGMGHASSIALGIALAKPDRQVYCFDGDGAAIMHLGSMGVAGQVKPANFHHIIFNNEAHDSVGGQPTAAATMNFPAIALACGYTSAKREIDEVGVASELKEMAKQSGPNLLEIVVAKGSRKDLGRPTRTPKENKSDFMKFVDDAK